MDDPSKRDDLAAFLAANKRDELAKLGVACEVLAVAPGESC